MRITEAQLGWLAGMIDADGSINATKSGTGGVTNCQVNIASNNWHVVERLKYLLNLVTGEHVAAYKVGANLNDDCWTVRVSRKRTLKSLLTAILRHLVQKKPQAAHMLCMVDRSWDNNGCPPWIDRFGRKIQWFNQHRTTPEGQYVLTGYAKTAQSRGRLPTTVPPAEPVETLRGTPPSGDEKVHQV